MKEQYDKGACKKCSGKGKIGNDKCKDCNGTGKGKKILNG